MFTRWSFALSGFVVIKDLYLPNIFEIMTSYSHSFPCRLSSGQEHDKLIIIYSILK